MAQFNLTWINTVLLINPNVTAQRALYRQKSIGGAFINTGFTPSNDLPVTASAVSSPVLADNRIWEFKIQAICTVGGPTDNQNGIQEGLKFACIQPIVSASITTAQAVLNVANTDIIKARFTVHRDDNNAVAFGPVTVNRVGNSITANATGLSGSTDYYWETELYTTVNGVEVISSALPPVGLGVSCISNTFTTDDAICDPLTDIDVSAVNT